MSDHRVMNFIIRNDGLIVPQLKSHQSIFEHCTNGLCAINKEYFKSHFSYILFCHGFLIGHSFNENGELIR